MSYITVKDMNEVTHLIQTKNVVNLSFTEAEATFTLVCGPMLKEVVAKEILTDLNDLGNKYIAKHYSLPDSSYTDGIGIQHRLEFHPIVPLIKTLTFDLFNDRA